MGLQVTYEVTDDIWYYPVPLTNLKGMSLDIHFATTAVGWIAQKRPWWAIIMSLLGFAMLACAPSLPMHSPLCNPDALMGRSTAECVPGVCLGCVWRVSCARVFLCL